MRIIKYPILLAFLLFNACIYAQKIESAYESANRNIAADEVLDKAKEYFGSKQLVDFTEKNIIKPELIYLKESEDSTPFLHNLLVGRKIWKVSFKNVIIKYSEITTDSLDQYARDFDVYIDPQDGRLLKVVASKNASPWKYKKAVSLQEREDSWRKTNTELVLPNEVPVPFSTALSKCFHHPHLAAEIEAIFVTIKYSGERPPRTRWLITLRGVPPFPSNKEIPEEIMSTVLVFADPITGETTGASIPAD